MKKISLVIMVICGILTLVACRKSYPKDIPDWLKEKIKGIEKEKKGTCCCLNPDCFDILEYTDENNTIFRFKSSESGGALRYSFYTFEGERCDVDEDINQECDVIPNLENYHFVRLVWEEEFRKPLIP